MLPRCFPDASQMLGDFVEAKHIYCRPSPD
jgi:hypothetical protein